MKKTAILFVVLLLLTLVSCNMEKRLYRNGWYKEHTQSIKRTDNNFSAPAPEAAMQSPNQAGDSTTTIITADTIIEKAVPDPVHKPNPVKEFKKRLDDEPALKKPKMSYAEAMASMAKQGCTPNKFAKTVYLLSLISIGLMFFGGLGILPALITLLLTVFAVDSVTANGTCVEENLAIIHAAQRNCWITLLIFALITILVIGFIVFLFGVINWWQ